MLLAPRARRQRRARSPSACAASSSERLGGGSLERVEVAGPGFLNLFLSDAWYRRAARARARAPGERLRRRRADRGPERILVEFVSANPTGPAARRRRPPRRLRRLAGARCSSSPGTRSSASTTSTTPAARSTSSPTRSPPGCGRAEPPEDGYQGEYVAELGARRSPPKGSTPTTARRSARRGIELMLARIRETLERFGVDFDNWFSERACYDGDRRGRARARRARARAATSTATRARSGCAPPSSATTRTGS